MTAPLPASLLIGATVLRPSSPRLYEGGVPLLKLRVELGRGLLWRGYAERWSGHQLGYARGARTPERAAEYLQDQLELLHKDVSTALGWRPL